VINDFGVDGLNVRYNFSSAAVRNKIWNNSYYNYFYIKDFSQLRELGKPMLPVHTDLVFIPEGASINLNINQLTTTTYNNFRIFPAQKESTDQNSNASNIPYYDSVLYNSTLAFPSQVVRLKKIIEIRGQRFAVIEVYPMQIKPSQQELLLHSTIEYSITFSNTSKFISYNNYSHSFLKQIPNLVINKPKLQNSINGHIAISQPNMQIGKTNYVIVCPQEFKDAADTLAKWKSQLGYNVEVIQDVNVSAANVKSKLESIYNDSLASLEYVLLLGDYEQLPSKRFVKNGKIVYTDNYYACFGDSNDVVPDVALGRVSVHNLSSAFKTIHKIINYEKNPSFNSAYYNNASLISYFVEDANGFEEKNYISIAEKIRSKLLVNGIQSQRLYACKSGISPSSYNNTIYSLGGDIDNALHKPSFAWSTNSNKINQALSNPKLFVLYRSSSYYGGFSQPRYENNNLAQLNNSDLPVLFDLSGKSGNFREYNCIAESFLSKDVNGAIAVFSNGSDIATGINDALSLCLIDAIWPNSGIVPDFQTVYTGLSNINNSPVMRLGDIKNQALYKMPEVWSSNEDVKSEAFASLNLFGDPAMLMLRSVPQIITASSVDTLYCSVDNQLIVTSNVDGVATLMVNDILVAKKYIKQGTDTILFDPVIGTNAILTISRDGYKPFIKNLSIVGNCFSANIGLNIINNCVNDSIHVFNILPYNSLATYNWNFGVDAVPQFATGNGPYSVIYNSGGSKMIQLTMTVGSQQRIYNKSVIIDDICLKRIPSIGNEVNRSCSGTLTDNGGLENYTNNVLGSFTISPDGASQVSINFTQLDMIGINDKINIYDGPNTNANLIVSLSGNNIPSMPIVSSGSSITIEQQTDAENTASGFVLNWNCISATNLPQASFICSDSNSCNSIIEFFDISSGGASQWQWDFGDGTNSSSQHPIHKYLSNGVYSVKLKVSNSFGIDSIVKNSYITISMPQTPIISDEIRCKEGSVEFINQSNKTVYWYTQDNEVFLDSGINFSTPIIDSTTYYSASTFVNSQDKSLGITAPGINTYYRNNSEIEGLLFNVYENTRLLSVDVYSQSQNNVTIYLFNSAGAILNQKNCDLVAGKNTVLLNWSLMHGISYKLAASKSSKLLCQYNPSFPYSVDNMLTIKANSNSINNNDYYFFFNWKIREEAGCLSQKVDIAAIVSDTLGAKSNFSIQKVSNKVKFENLSNYADSYYWDFGDGDFSLQDNPQHIYHNDGLYNVTLIATNDCGQSTFSKTVQITNTSLQNVTAIGSISIFPNPARELLNVKIVLLNSERVELIMKDVVGRSIGKYILNSYGQTINKQIDVSKVSPGVYYLEFNTQNSHIVKKVIIK
jgi:PKD repeat protein